MDDVTDISWVEIAQSLLVLVGVGLSIALMFGAIGWIVTFEDRAAARRRRRDLKKKQAPDPTKPVCTCRHWFNSHRLTAPHACVTPTCVCQGYMGPDPTISGMWIAEEPPKKRVQP